MSILALCLAVKRLNSAAHRENLTRNRATTLSSFVLHSMAASHGLTILRGVSDCGYGVIKWAAFAPPPLTLSFLNHIIKFLDERLELSRLRAHLFERGFWCLADPYFPIKQLL